MKNDGMPKRQKITSFYWFKKVKNLALADIVWTDEFGAGKFDGTRRQDNRANMEYQLTDKSGVPHWVKEEDLLLASAEEKDEFNNTKRQ